MRNEGKWVGHQAEWHKQKPRVASVYESPNPSKRRGSRVTALARSKVAENRRHPGWLWTKCCGKPSPVRGPYGRVLLS